MSLAAFGLALAFASALTSAFTHALLKSVDDKLAQRVWSCLICAAAALPLIAWTGPLPERFWLLLAAFAVVSAINQIILVRSYEISDFSAAYPVARGVVPLATTVGGIFLLGDRLSVPALSGVVAITAGVVALALGKGMSRSGWIAAISTGITTIGYNLLAAHGIRDATDPVNFLAWLYIFDAVILPLYLLAARWQSNDRSPWQKLPHRPPRRPVDAVFLLRADLCHALRARRGSIRDPGVLGADRACLGGGHAQGAAGQLADQRRIAHRGRCSRNCSGIRNVHGQSAHHRSSLLRSPQ